MVLLVEAADVLDRLAVMPGFKVPSTLTPERLNSYIEGASAIVMQKAGYATPPEDASASRGVLDDLVIRLTVLTVLGDIFGNNAEMREANRRERNDLLKEASELADDDEATSGTGGRSTFFEVVGAQ